MFLCVHRNFLPKEVLYEDGCSAVDLDCRRLMSGGSDRHPRASNTMSPGEMAPWRRVNFALAPVTFSPSQPTLAATRNISAPSDGRGEGE
jgi:hypothetical protein